MGERGMEEGMVPRFFPHEGLGERDASASLRAAPRAPPCMPLPMPQ